MSAEKEPSWPCLPSPSVFAFCTAYFSRAPRHRPRSRHIRAPLRQEILSGTGWITEPYSPRAPGYPVFLALFYALAVKQIWLVTFIQRGRRSHRSHRLPLGRSVSGSVLALAAALWFALDVQHMHVGYALERNVVAFAF